MRLDADTSMSPGTFEALLRAVGGATMAADEVIAKRADNAFCAMRPPGHHAETVRAMGFCFFNTAAITARHVQKRHGISRAAVVDFDVHHGNETQEIFWSDPTVMYCSTHEMPLYPGSGAPSERGVHNNIVNAPLRAGDGGEQFREAFETVILPRLAAFAPEFLVIGRVRRPHPRPAGEPQSRRGRLRLGHPQAHGGRRTERLRPHRFGAGRRLRSSGTLALRRRPRHRVDARMRGSPRTDHDGQARRRRHLEFERAIEELETIVKRLEDGKVPLEELVAIYERGEVLKRRCEHLLRQAEARVEKITLDASGKPKGVEPLDVK